MDIAFIHEEFNYLTGGRYYSYFLACALVELGHQVVIYTNRRPVFLVDFKLYKQPKIVIVIDLKRLLKSAVEADIYIGSPLLGAVIASELGVKYHKSSYALIFDPEPAREKYLGKRNTIIWEKIITQLKLSGTKIISLCDSMSQYIYPWLDKKKDQVTAIYPCINSRTLNSKRRDFTKKDYVVFISRLVSHKNFEDVVKAVSQTNLRLKVISSVFNYNTKEIVKKYRMQNRVDYYLKCSDDTKFDLICASRGVINASLFEGWGLFISEAIACGVPFIGYDYPTYREQIKLSKATNIYLAKYKDVEDLTEKLKQALEEKKYLEPNHTFDFDNLLKRLEALNLNKIYEEEEIEIKYKDSPISYPVICEGLVYGVSGFAEAVRNIAWYLDQKRVNIEVKPHDKAMADNVDITTTPKGKFISQASRIKYLADKKIRIVMTIPEGIKRQSNDYQIAYIMFETKDFPQKYVNHLNIHVDEIWTPSQFNVENITRAGWNKPIYCMPLGVDIERFNPDIVTPFIKGQSPIAGFLDKFIFLMVGSWNERKGIALLIEAFLAEFKNDNVLLYIKTGWRNIHLINREYLSILRRFRSNNTKSIYIDNKVYKDEEWPKIYKNANAFVLASRGEGWGLNYTEAMAMGLPVIGTLTTSMLDYLTDKNSFPVNIDGYGVEPRCDWVIPDYKNQIFSIPSIQSLREQMRLVYNNSQEAKKRGLVARDNMIKKYSWDKVADKWINRLKEIAVEVK